MLAVAGGIDADVVPPPVDIDVSGARRAPDGVAPGFVLCVSRLLPYKNVDAVVEAFTHLPSERLVVVGTGPGADALAVAAPPNVQLLGRVEDDVLRWLYANALGLVAASYEDFGLTPVEAAAFGRPTAALRWGGFLDTIVEDATGVFFDDPDPRSIADAITRLAATGWSTADLEAHAGRFAPERFIDAVDRVVAEVRPGA